MSLVVLQRGHCFRNKGATGTAHEQEWNGAACDAAAAALKAAGHTTRVINADVSMSDYKGDYFIAIHGDGNKNKKVRGASVGWRLTADKTMAQIWKEEYVNAGWSGGFHADNYTKALHLYYGTANAHDQDTPRAIIVEGGFLTNAKDRAILLSDEGPKMMATAIVKTIQRLEGKTPPVIQPIAGEDIVTLQDKKDIVALLLSTDLGHPGGGDTVAVALQSSLGNSAAALKEARAAHQALIKIAAKLGVPL
jgi:hypothetical protein